MSTTTVAPRTALPAIEPIPFRRLLGVEFRKSYDTRSSFWLLVTIAIMVLGGEVIALIVVGTHDTTGVDFGTFSTVAGFLSSVLLPVLGILLVSSEWSQRTAMVTFALEPRRGRVIWAKLVVGIELALITIVGALGLGAICNVIYGTFPNKVTDWANAGDMIHGIIGFTILQILNMLVGFALASLCLSSPTAIVVFFIYSFLVPTIIGIASALMHWFKEFAPWIDFNAAQGKIFDWDMGGKDWAHLLVSGFIWVVVPFFLGAWRIFHAEVK